jgi:hypothetical protein
MLKNGRLSDLSGVTPVSHLAVVTFALTGVLAVCCKHPSALLPLRSHEHLPQCLGLARIPE